MARVPRQARHGALEALGTVEQIRVGEILMVLGAGPKSRSGSNLESGIHRIAGAAPFVEAIAGDVAGTIGEAEGADGRAVLRSDEERAIEQSIARGQQGVGA